MIDLDLPSKDSSYYDSFLRYSLHPDLIFVFGSNEQGVHGAGAAKDAYELFGAIPGQGFGLQGQSFAIPTRRYNRLGNGKYKMTNLSIDEIRVYVNEFLDIILEQQDHYFFVTALGTGRAGYQHSDIAPMFKRARNCWFPDVWKQYLT